MSCHEVFETGSSRGYHLVFQLVFVCRSRKYSNQDGRLFSYLDSMRNIRVKVIILTNNLSEVESGITEHFQTVDIRHAQIKFSNLNCEMRSRCLLKSQFLEQSYFETTW